MQLSMSRSLGDTNIYGFDRYPRIKPPPSQPRHSHFVDPLTAENARYADHCLHLLANSEGIEDVNKTSGDEEHRH